MKKAILQIHLWIGLLAALLLFCLGISGAMLVFEDQIDHALNPRLSHVNPSSTALPLAALQRAAEQAHPGYRATGVYFPGSDDVSYAIGLESKSGPGIEVAINQYTGEVLGTWDDRRFVRKLHGFHTQFLAGRVGSNLVGWSGGVFLLFLSVTGLVLWWPHKLRVFRWSSFGTKFQYDLHNTVGFYASVFLLVFALTGIAIHWERGTERLAEKISAVPARQPMPNVSVPAGAPQLTADQLVVSAQKAATGARVTGIRLPDEPDAPAFVTLKFPEDHTPAGRTQAFIDPYTGKVLKFSSSREMPWAVSYARRVNRELHTGDFLGWPSKLLAAFFSLALPILAASGPLIWWNRKMASRRALARSRTIAA